MKTKIIAAAILTVLFSGCGQKEPSGLNGKFFLWTKVSSAHDAIEFFPDGRCVVGERECHAGTFRTYPDGRLLIEGPNMVATADVYQYRLTEHILRLTRSDKTELIYARPPRRPTPGWQEIVGTYACRTERAEVSSEEVGAYTADQKFISLQRYYSNRDKTYREYKVTGNWYYSDGVATYRVEDCTPPFPVSVAYWRAFVTKKDKNGIWFLDSKTEKMCCASPASVLALPPPAQGFRLVQ